MTGPIRITHLITDSGTGGAEKILYELVRRLDPERYQSRVIVMKQPGRTAQMLVESGVPVLSLKLPARTGAAYFLKMPLAFFKLLRELKSERPHVLHCWLFQANLLGRLAARLTGVPANISGLRVAEMERTGQYGPDRWSAGLVTRYAAVCEAVAAHYREKLGLAAERIAVVRNGIDPVPFAEADPGALKRELGIAEGSRVIGALGRLHRQKGLDTLVRAMPALLGRFPDLVLVIAGDGPERDRLGRLAESEGVAGSVKFPGEWHRAPEFMAALDVFVLPSRWEGMPNALLEAMAAGVPAVASRVGGVAEIMAGGGPGGPVAGETGIMIEPEDARALARAVSALLEDEKRRTAMGSSARRRARSEFSLDQMVRGYEALYKSLLETS
ncbi:MAG TPA: glycosyltransferase [bacterium]|nr:glycosyltransferase [bacterium]